MNNKQPVFNVKLNRTENEQIIATNSANQKLVMTANWTKPELGFKAPEVVLTALWSCILVNLNKIAKEMDIKVENPQLEITSKKRMEPLWLEEVNVSLTVKTDASKEELDKLFNKALVTWTATWALLEWIKVNWTLKTTK